MELIPATREMLAGDQGDRSELRRLLRATIPSSWPPVLLDETTIREFFRLATSGEDKNFHVWYWVLVEGGDAGRTLVGSGGTATCPQEPDTVIIGYSVAEGFEGQGYATEAVGKMIPAIFTSPGIRRILATTYPELKGSICVLEKNGFLPAPFRGTGSGIGEGTLAFFRERPDLH